MRERLAHKGELSADIVVVQGDTKEPWPHLSTEWRDYTRPKAGTPMPRRSPSARWRSTKKCLVRTIPMWRWRCMLSPTCTRRRASTSRRSGSRSARWRSTKRALVASHPDRAATLFDLAKVQADAGDIRIALDNVRKATAAVIAHAATEAPSAPQRSDSNGLVAQRADYFLRHVAYLDAAVEEGIEPLPAVMPEAFEMAQWANHSSAAAAVQQVGLRFAAGTDALAAL